MPFCVSMLFPVHHNSFFRKSLFITQAVRTLLAAVLLLIGALVLVLPSSAQSCAVNIPHLQGTWRTLPYLMPINPINATLLHTGQVLIVAGSENDGKNNTPGAESYRNAVWDPQGTTESSIAVQSINYDVFCSGTAVLPDGRPFVIGGTSEASPYSTAGDKRSSVFDPATSRFAQSQSMSDGRWYGTATALSDGRIMAFSGLSLSGPTNNTVEIYDVTNAGAGWTAPVAAPFTPPLFPRMFQLPNGQVFYNGQGSGAATSNAWIFHPATGSWTQSAASTADRQYGSAVLLPLLPPSYTPKVMNFGGGNPATRTTEMIDLSASSPAWTSGPPMSTGRIHMNAVILPNGKVLAEGGSVNSESPDPAGRQADLYDPVANTFTSAGTASYSRLYHSNALLLPDATVVSMGSNPGWRGSYQPAIEIYTPPYLFDGNDHLITNRPNITGISAAVIGYNTPFSVTYTSGSQISSAVLVRPGSSTHAFDMEQRLIGLCGPAPEPPCTGSGTLNLTSPPNGGVAPPGYYMLFLLDGTGVPSVAKFIQISPYVTTPPRGAVSVPAFDVTIPAGGTVSFSTASTAAKYSWVFPGGSPSTSNVQVPGNVTFSAPGTYTASLTVIDSSGNSDPSPPTRTITVLPPAGDFSVQLSPSSQSTIPGQSATFTVTITGVNSFNGPVSFGVTSDAGFPTGIASGGFSPSSITGSGASTLTMNTSTSALPYALSLTVTASSGSLSHTASTTLLVNLVAPASLTATPGPGQVSLSWQPSAAATGYHVKRSITKGGPYIGVGCATTTAFTDTGLSGGTTYYYVVSADFQGGPNSGGESADSNEMSAVPGTGGPPPPPRCQISSVSSGPPAQVNFTMEDTNSGLKSIVLSDEVNASTSIPAFSSGTSGVIVTATQMSSSQKSTVHFQVTNVAGVATTCGATFGGQVQWTGSGGSFSNRIVVATNADGRLQAFTRGTDNALWTIPQASPDGGWSNWLSLGGILKSDPAVAANSDGRLQVFVVGGDNALYTMAQTSAGSSTWSSWIGLGGILISNPIVARNATGTLQVFGLGTDREIWTRTQTSPGGSFSNWSTLGGTIINNPSVIANQDGRLQLFVFATDSSLWTTSQTTPGGGWSGWSRLGASLAGDPVPAINQDGTLQVFATGSDGALWTVAQSSPGGAWAGFKSLGGVLSGIPASARNSDGRLEVFVRGTDNALWRKAQLTPGGSWSDWIWLGGVLASGPAAATNTDGRMAAFVEGTDQGLWTIEQTAPGFWD